MACGGKPASHAPAPPDTTHRETARGASGPTICDTMLASAKRPSATITASSRDTIAPDPISGKPWRPGCVFAVSDTTDDPDGGTSAVEKWLINAKWIQANYGTDGPDGTMFSYAKGPRLCVVRGRWDGGDDSDTTYVPKPGYQMTVSCVTLAGEDTAGYGARQREK
jgi:hypothetical protein